MTKTIRRYRLNLTGMTAIHAPAGAVVRSVALFVSHFYLWIEGDEDGPCEYRYFAVFGDEQPLELETGAVKEYVGTVHFQRNGFHVYEMTKIWARD